MRTKLSILFCTLFAFTHAQVNPKQGYIITNENDTVMGVIDYRSDRRNASECIFQKEGKGEYVSYQPADIKGYRFLNNGAFYVTKRVRIANKEQLLFAEYLLKGGVNLYYISDKVTNYYYFESDEGKTGLVQERNFLDYNTKERWEIRQQDMNELAQVFHKSSETVEQLWKTDYNREDLTSLTRKYSEEYCTEHGDCVQFVYDEKKTASIKLRFYAGISMKAGSITPKYIQLQRNHDFSLSAFSPNVSVGLDLLFPRISKHLIAQIGLDLGYIKATKDSRQLTGCPLQTQWGLAYLFNTEKKVSPLIRGGITFNHLLGASGKGMEGVSGDNKKFQDMDFGFYVGAGADIALGKHTLRLSINYDYSSSIGLFNAMDNESLKTSAIDIRAGILF